VASDQWPVASLVLVVGRNSLRGAEARLFHGCGGGRCGGRGFGGGRGQQVPLRLRRFGMTNIY
jgi:hypothetical protein